jgi:hypothetical protein
VIFVALLGLITSMVMQAFSGVRLFQVTSSLPYAKGIEALLAVGLFASVYGISRRELRQNVRIVLVAITVGVAVKALLTGGIMVLAYGSGGYLLLGVAVAQIDPLSVAANLKHSAMSQRARSILSAWASFDDPVTVLLVAYLAGFILSRPGPQGSAALMSLGSGIGVEQVALNTTLVAVAGLTWLLLGWAVRGRNRAVLRNVLLSLALAALIAVAVSFNLLIGIAVCGLFFRPAIGVVLSRVTDTAFYGATFCLGMLLVTGVNVPAGILLGASVFGVQILAGTALGRRLSRRDRMTLALGQQNGLTAIVLALALQPYLSAAVGIIAVAILVVYLLHISSNSVWEFTQDRGLQRGKVNEPTTMSGGEQATTEKEPAGLSITAG